MKNPCCRFCGKELNTVFVDLGLSPLSNQYLSKEQLNRGQSFYPLVVDVCEACWMVQTRLFQRPEDIFTDYKYLSSFSKSWLKHCKAYVDGIVPALGLNAQSSVVEIACNDGYLLQYFKPHGINAYGVEPAENVAQEAQKLGIPVEVAFFDRQLVPSLIQKHGQADLIIGNNVLAHVPDISGFVEGMHLLLKESGTITMEFPHLLELMRDCQFDTIYHEHFSYLSLSCIQTVFKAHGMQISKVEQLPTHGGSIRIYANQLAAKVPVDPSVARLLALEKEFGMQETACYKAFEKAVQRIKRESVLLFCRLLQEGKRIAAFGAAAKGNTFLNYCGIGRETIPYVVDSNPHKQGLYLPGTLIPVVTIQHLLEDKPDYVVIFPWNLSAEIEKELEPIRAWGGKLITCIPEIRIF